MQMRDKLFIGGQWVAPSAKDTIDVHSAGTGEVMGKVPAGGEKDIDAAAKAIKRKVDANMANAIFKEVAVKGYNPKHFIILSYGGGGPIHACGYAGEIGVSKILIPPFSSVFSALGAGNMNQLHIHEKSLYLMLYDATFRHVLEDYSVFNATVAELEERGHQCLWNIPAAVGAEPAMSIGKAAHRHLSSPPSIVSALRRNKAHRLDKGPYLGGILSTGRRFHSAAHVHPVGTHRADGVGHVRGGEPARKEHVGDLGHLCRQAPVDHLPRAAVRRLTVGINEKSSNARSPLVFGQRQE